MAKGTKFTFTTAEGKVETRTSERVYTHIVVGRDNLAALRAQAQNAASVASLKDEYTFRKNCASVNVGEKYPGRSYEVDAAMHASATACMAQYSTVDEYVKAKIAEHLTRIGDADAGPQRVLQWSMTHRAALGAVGKWQKWHVDVQVIAL
ncbi:MAG: hypothetical protein JWQ19_3925 [Subtercola sp.]|nr:hypothetical protein [Subtercola sp.]